MPIKLVVFDLGGVLVRINHAWEGAMRAAGFSPTDIRGERLLIHSELLERYQAGQVSDDDYLAALQKELELEGRGDALRVHDHILDSPYRGTLEIIGGLKAKGIKTACLSNTNGLHWAEMTETGRFPNVLALDFKLASHELLLAKPDPGIFRACEEACGFKSDEIVFFDDGAGHVAAARQAGWTAFVVEPGREPAEQIAESLRELGF